MRFLIFGSSYLAPVPKTGFLENVVAKKAEFFVEKPGFFGLVVVVHACAKELLRTSYLLTTEAGSNAFG